MITTTSQESIRNVKTIEEVKNLIVEALNSPDLKSVGVFVWADKDAGIEVKVRTESKDESL